MAYSFNPFTGKLDDVGAGGGGTTDASLLTSGTLADARLSANVVTLTGTQTLTNKSISSSQITGLSAVAASGSAADLTTGTLPLARLNSLVALDNQDNAFSVGQTIASGTLTASTPALTATQTWNDGAVAFTAIRANVTDTASASTSLLLDLQVGGTSVFKVDKTGSPILGSSANYRTVNAFINNRFMANNTAVYVGSTAFIGFTANSLAEVADADTRLYRDAGNTLSQRNGTTAQALRVYNTFTDASNYERGVFDWTTNANTLTIGTLNAGTGTARRVRIQSAESFDIICGGSNRPAGFSTSQVNLFNSTNFAWYTGTSDPTSTTSPFSNGSGTCAIYKNTTTGVVKLWVNNAGTMVSVALA